MNVYDGIHWNIYEILPYQRNFNFINGERSLGKTYTCLMFIIDKCIHNSCEFVYLVRTQDEKKHGVMKEAFAKVIANEFSDYEFDFTNENVSCETEDGKRNIGYCIALSEALKIKKRSFPLVKYLMFDEYMLEDVQESSYVNGWKEPDLFLSIYHTIDREEDRVKCFLMGNNTKFHNPYHMHPAFNIPLVEKGEIWIGKNVLFQYAESSEALKEKKSQSKFLEMIDGSKYGQYAKDGIYLSDNYSFVEKLEGNSRYLMTIAYMDVQFGIWQSVEKGLLYVSDKIDPSCKFIFALTIDSHKENTMLIKSRGATHLKFLATHYKNGCVRFVSMEVKLKAEKAIALLL